MGDVGVHSQCIIVGDFLLNTVDKLREELIVNKEITNVLEDVSIETKRRQVIEYLVTLYFKYRLSKPSLSQHIVTCFDVKSGTFYPQLVSGSSSETTQGAAQVQEIDTGQRSGVQRSTNTETGAANTTNTPVVVTPKKKRGRPRKSLQSGDNKKESPHKPDSTDVEATTIRRNLNRKRKYRSEAVIQEQNLRIKSLSNNVKQGIESEKKIRLSITPQKNSNDSSDTKILEQKKTFSPRVTLVKLPADLWADKVTSCDKESKNKKSEFCNTISSLFQNEAIDLNPSLNDISDSSKSASSHRNTGLNSELKPDYKQGRKVRTNIKSQGKQNDKLNLKQPYRNTNEDGKTITDKKGNFVTSDDNEHVDKNDLEKVESEVSKNPDKDTDFEEATIFGIDDSDNDNSFNDYTDDYDSELPDLNITEEEQEVKNNSLILEMKSEISDVFVPLYSDLVIIKNSDTGCYNESEAKSSSAQDAHVADHNVRKGLVKDALAPPTQNENNCKKSSAIDSHVASENVTDVKTGLVKDAHVETLNEKDVKNSLLKDALVATQKETNNKKKSVKDAQKASPKRRRVPGQRSGGRKVSLEVIEDDPQNYVKVTEVTAEMKLTDLYFKIPKQSKLELVCRVCDYHAFDTARMKVHLRIHTGSKVKVEPVVIDNTNKYGCPKDNCSYQGSNKATVARHYHSVHRKLLSCNQCVKTFSYRYELKRHVLKSHTDTPFCVCSICGKGYQSQCGLLQHQRVRHPQGTNLYMCHICDKQLSSRTRLQDHLASAHMQKLLHRCQLCKKQFRWATSLKRHVESTHNDKTVSCNLCEATFTSSSALKDHKTHFHNEASRCMTCVHCGNSYKWERSLKRHIAKRHPKEKDNKFLLF